MGATGELVRVGGETQPMGVARHLAEELGAGAAAVVLQGVGQASVHRMVKAVALAESEMGTGELWMRASFEVVAMDRGDERTAIRLEVRRGGGGLFIDYAQKGRLV